VAAQNRRPSFESRAVPHLHPCRRRNHGKEGYEGHQKESRKARTREHRHRQRFLRRGAKGRFKESDGVGKSLASDPRKPAKTKARRGQGDRGDR
jgi:hypothetical protein